MVACALCCCSDSIAGACFCAWLRTVSSPDVNATVFLDFQFRQSNINAAIACGCADPLVQSGIVGFRKTGEEPTCLGVLHFAAVQFSVQAGTFEATHSA
jgi:hypothetical protein